ncbi:MAG: thrombospondin type 3 repeat-containing protein [Myxococcota bacterium]
MADSVRQKQLACGQVWCVSLLLLLGSFSSSLSAAEETPSELLLPIQQFEPFSTHGLDFASLQGARALPPLTPAYGLLLQYAQRPLQVSSTDGSLEVDVIRDHIEAALFVALGLGDGLMFQAALPLTAYQAGGDVSTLELPALPEQALGDLRLSTRWAPPALQKSWQSALALNLSLPTGTSNSFQHGQFSVEPRLVLSRVLPPDFRLGFNLGYRLRAPASFLTLTVGPEVTYGGALAWELLPQLHLMAELFGRVGLADVSQAAVSTTPLELTLAARHRSRWGHVLTAGVGRGLTAGYGTPDLRVWLGYAFSSALITRAPDQDRDGVPDGLDRCPTQPEDADGFDDEDGCPELDNDADGLPDALDDCPRDAEDRDGVKDGDGCPDRDSDLDGIPDELDRCPEIAEIPNGVADQDGCPERDSDGDGVPDPLDRCPRLPENLDGIQDQDGCPEGDRDQDGLLDVADACPERPENMNGLQDEDGCPEPDQDNDRIFDADDRCPTLPEQYNQYLDEDGCPDERPRAAGSTLQVGALYLFFAVDDASLNPRSQEVLQRVQQYLLANPSSSLVLVGHADADGDTAANQSLGARRADAGAGWLLSRGISPERLRSQSLGEQAPRQSNSVESGKAENRRVEIQLLGPRGEKLQNLPAWMMVPWPTF